MARPISALKREKRAAMLSIRIPWRIFDALKEVVKKGKAPTVTDYVIKVLDNVLQKDLDKK